MTHDKPLGIVLVTGGSGTLGRAIVAAVQPHASRVWATAHSAATSSNSTIAVDFRSAEGLVELSRWFAEHGEVDTLINSAGVYLRRPLARMAWTDWQELFSVNLFATAEVTRLAVAAGCTNVINLTDAGWHRGWPNHAAYLASKAGVVALTRALAAELAPAVRVNAVAPGIISVPEGAGRPASKLVSNIPAGRLGTAAEVAEVVLTILLGPSYLTGEVIAVDGGYAHR